MIRAARVVSKVKNMNLKISSHLKLLYRHYYSKKTYTVKPREMQDDPTWASTKDEILFLGTDELMILLTCEKYSRLEDDTRV